MKQLVKNGINFLLGKGYTVKELKNIVNDLDFNMGSPFSCVCGQLVFDDFSLFLNLYDLSIDEAIQLGFTILIDGNYTKDELFRKLTQEWVKQVNLLSEE